MTPPMLMFVFYLCLLHNNGYTIMEDDNEIMEAVDKFASMEAFDMVIIIMTCMVTIMEMVRMDLHLQKYQRFRTNAITMSVSVTAPTTTISLKSCDPLEGAVRLATNGAMTYVRSMMSKLFGGGTIGNTFVPFIISLYKLKVYMWQSQVENEHNNYYSVGGAIKQLYCQ